MEITRSLHVLRQAARAVLLGGVLACPGPLLAGEPLDLATQLKVCQHELFIVRQMRESFETLVAHQSVVPRPAVPPPPKPQEPPPEPRPEPQREEKP